MRILLAVALLLILNCPIFAADEPETFGAMGMSWNQYAAPQISGNLLYAKRIDDGLYSFNFVDVISKSMQPFSTATSVTTGIGKRVGHLYGAPIYLTTGVGVLAGERNTGYSWQSGGTIALGLGKGWELLPNVRVIKSSLTDFQFIVGIMIGLGK